MGDPGAQVIPMAQSNGEVQENELTLDNFQYGGIMNVVRELDVGFTPPFEWVVKDPPFTSLR
jgi:hypothetical protein